jgi:hypothetical protein
MGDAHTTTLFILAGFAVLTISWLLLFNASFLEKLVELEIGGGTYFFGTLVIPLILLMFGLLIMYQIINP